MDVKAVKLFSPCHSLQISQSSWWASQQHLHRRSSWSSGKKGSKPTPAPSVAGEQSGPSCSSCLSIRCPLGMNLVCWARLGWFVGSQLCSIMLFLVPRLVPWYWAHRVTTQVLVDYTALSCPASG